MPALVLTVGGCSGPENPTCPEFEGVLVPFELEPGVADERPPEPLTEILVASYRAEERCEWGYLYVEFDAGVDFENPPDALGYRLRIVDGELPPALAEAIPAGPIFAPADSEPAPYDEVSIVTLKEVVIPIRWDDRQPLETFAFTLAVSVVDGAGNESPAREVEVIDNARGCAVATESRRCGLGLVGLLGLVVVGVRRRRGVT